MSHHWREQLDRQRHRDFRETGVGGVPAESTSDPLKPQWTYFVEVKSFTFQFASLAQLEECLSHFQQRIHPSSRQQGIHLEHYWQRWYERLPLWLFDEKTRLKVVDALQLALDDFKVQLSKD